MAELVRQNCTPEHIHSYPGVHETLARLKEAGHVLVALTNGFAKYQVPVLEGLGLMQYLSGIYTPRGYWLRKTRGRVLCGGSPRLRLPHVHVGDTVAHDVWGAKQSGAVTVWLYHNLLEEIAGLPLMERTGHPKLLEVIAEVLARDLTADGYPDLTPRTACLTMSWRKSTIWLRLLQHVQESHQRGPAED